MSKTIYRVLIILGLITLFMLLSRILVLITRTSVLEQSSSYTDLEICTSDKGLSAIDSFAQNNDLFRSISITGWSFIENTWDTSDKTIALVFADCQTTKRYIIEARTLPRPDINNAFYTHEIVGTNHGFWASFSPIWLPDGYYRLLIYNYENTITHGLLDTYRIYSVKSGEFKLVNHNEITATVTRVKKTTVSDKLSYYIDIIIPSESDIFITGWAYVQNMESADNKTLLKIINSKGDISYYKSLTDIRPDVAEHFKNDKYYYSGFSAVIPIEAFSEGENMIVPVIGEDHLEAANPYIFQL